MSQEPYDLTQQVSQLTTAPPSAASGVLISETIDAAD